MNGSEQVHEDGVHGDAVDFGAVLRRHKVEVAEAARSVAHAVYAEVPLVDRLRAAEGVVLSLVLAGRGPCHGRLEETGRDAVRLRPTDGSELVVPLRHVLAVAGAGPGHRAPRSVVERSRGLAGLLRAWLDQDVVVEVAAGSFPGVLERVGTDHLQLATAGGPLLVPFAAVLLVRSAGYQLEELSGPTDSSSPSVDCR